MISSLLKRYYGDFSAGELRKYIFLGIIFALIVGLMWALMPLRDTLFCQSIIGFGQCQGRQLREGYLAFAKVFSLLMMIPSLLAYNKLLSRIRKKSILPALCGIYALMLIFFSFLISGVQPLEPSPWHISGWLWYALIESYNVFMVSAFWAFVIDISPEQSARRGFGIVMMIGQLGGIFLPPLINKLPILYALSIGGVLTVIALMLMVVMGLITLFVRTTPPALLQGYQHASLETSFEHKNDADIWQGIRMILAHRYLLGILALSFTFECVVNSMDFNFKTMVFAAYPNAILAGEYLAYYASLMSLTTFALLLVGVNNISRLFGLQSAFITVFIAMAATIITFAGYPSLPVLFVLLIMAKALNFSLNTPSIKQLYIPTNENARYKSQAWIETLGIGSAKTAASSLAFAKGSLEFSWFIILTCSWSLGLLTAWLIVALALARAHDTAIARKEFIC